jgi:hypothetical protein
MAGMAWAQWYWEKWEAEPTLKLVSFAAQGLWMRLLCLMAKEGGQLKINGKRPSLDTIARIIGHQVAEIEPLLKELEEAGVYSRTQGGVIINRRMFRGQKSTHSASVPAEKTSVSDPNPNLFNDIVDHKNLEGEDREDPRPPRGTAPKVDVEEVWKITPTKSRQRTTRAEIAEALHAAYGRGHKLETILGGLKGYFASRDATREEGRYLKGVHRMIARDRWLSFVASASVTQLADHDPWPGRLKRWSWSLDWDLAWGPPPDAPGCKAPADGIETALAAAAVEKAKRDAARGG